MPKNAEHEPHTMNWKDVVKKIESLGQRFEYDIADGAKPEHFHGIENVIYHFIINYICVFLLFPSFCWNYTSAVVLLLIYNSVSIGLWFYEVCLTAYPAIQISSLCIRVFFIWPEVFIFYFLS